MNVTIKDAMKNILKITAKIYLWVSFSAFGCILLADVRSFNPSVTLAFDHVAFFAAWGLLAGSAFMAVVGYVAFLRQCAFTWLSGSMMFVAHVFLFLFALVFLAGGGRFGILG